MKNIVWGRHAVLEALRARPETVKWVLIAEGTTGDIVEEIYRVAKARKVRIAMEERRQISRLCRTDEHQGVIADLSGTLMRQADPVEVVREVRARGEMPFLLLLDQIQDPQNFGAVLRSAVAAGVHAVVIVNDRAVGVTPTVVKASAGASMHIPVCQVPNLVGAIEALKKEEVWIIGTDVAAEKSYAEFDWKRPVALVMGAEGEGLRRLVKDHCEDLVNIPLKGPVASLNVSVAAGIVLFEVVRSRSQSTKPTAKPQKSKK